MHRFSFGLGTKNGTCRWRDLRGKDGVAVFAAVLAVGLPWLLAQALLVRASGHLFPLMSSRHALSADALTGGYLVVFCMVLGLALFVAHRLLCRWLNR